MKYKEFFLEQQNAYISKLPEAKVEDDSQAKMLEGRDIRVVIRARPLLKHEVDQNYFSCVHAQNPNFHFFENKLDFKSSPKFNSENNSVDNAFGPEDDNQKVYQDIINPLIDLSLNGGFAVLFAYGQTGSGKTFTVNGILDRVFKDIQSR